MNNADAQVINMVNAPHIMRERRHKKWLSLVQRSNRHRKDRRRRASIRQAMMELTIKLELCLLAMGLIVIAIGHGVVAEWLGVLGIAGCIAWGAIEIDRHMER